MQKIFQEYGGVITTAMAIVALISVIGLFFTSNGDGWMDKAFHDVVDGFVNKVDDASPGEGGGSEETTLAAGLYQTGTNYGTPLKSWDTLISEGIITEDGKIVSGMENQLSEDLMISDTIMEIVADSYADCENLTSITIPDSVTSIGEYAFVGCDNLTTVIFGENNQLTSIGANAFWSCTNLTNITIPDSVTSIGVGAFRACASLTNVAIPEGVTAINDNTFNDCTSLKSVTPRYCG